MDHAEKAGVKILDIDRIPADNLEYFTGLVFGWDLALTTEAGAWNLIQFLTREHHLEFFSEFRPPNQKLPNGLWTAFFSAPGETVSGEQTGEGASMIEAIARAALKAHKRGVVHG